MPEGKIVKALSGFYYVSTNGQTFQCRGRGVFRKRKVSPLVGDFVEFQVENDLEGYILAIEERKNELIRPPIANVDQAILVFSAARPDFSTALLDRFLVLIESKQIEPLICITKIDLLDAEGEAAIKQYAANYRSFGYEVILTSSENLANLEILKEHLQGKTSVFAGQSGVGKSSLLNALKPELELKTDDISDSLGRGKHTTRHVELINVENGLVADTPGFSSLELTEVEAEELPQYFPEMMERSHECKFRGCLHINEPKCAVKAAVDAKDIPAYRYEHYLQFMDEIKERKPRY
ncbi:MULTISPECIES: ribosome small subunit-dependent GTPase A [Bacillaceae]|uniref:ribosome small subunit-dependent GTPase A n=1 Tax=Bacillaceae TaxID=186817 RepID=UPI000E70C489|nr:ribosome small subunit-dependent GTPase A [Bacillus sp. PK3_68]RJS62141.1 ribosome small subunit-dependent GTPase A [Bacillus sp. PK3_68]